MAYKNITIKSVIEGIERMDLVIPDIQRQYVWKEEQVENLFDSLMQGYPISTFLFWKVDLRNVKLSEDQLTDCYPDFYEFLKTFDKNNREATEKINIQRLIGKDFSAVVDGQQRLTSLYLALRGKINGKELYWNLDYHPQGDDIKKFQFELHKTRPDDGKCWCKVGEILSKTKSSEVKQLGQTDEHHDLLLDALDVLTRNEVLSFFEQDGGTLDDVLDIFVRTNSGGRPLSPSDLLMSYVTRDWDKNVHENVRNAFSELIEEHKDFLTRDVVLKTILYLFSKKDVRYKASNLRNGNIIKECVCPNWEKLCKSFDKACDFLSKDVRLDRDSFRAKNAIVPIVAFYYQNNNELTPDNKNLIRTWLLISLIKGVFSGQSDSLLKKLRDVIGGKAVFPLQDIRDEFRGNPKLNLEIEDGFADELLKAKKDSEESTIVLALLYSHLVNKNDVSTIAYHKDHLHPRAMCEKMAKERKMSKDEKAEFREKWDSVVNLQLLEGAVNQSKNDKPLDEWANGKSEADLVSLLIPLGVSYKLDDCEEFFEKRRELLKGKLVKFLDNLN